MMGVLSISSLVHSMMWLHCNSPFADAGVGGCRNVVPGLVAESAWLQRVLSGRLERLAVGVWLG